MAPGPRSSDGAPPGSIDASAPGDAHALTPQWAGGAPLYRHRLKLVASLAIAAAFALVLERGGLPVIPPWDVVARVRWAWAPPLMLLLVALHTVRGLRWRHMLRLLAPGIPAGRVLVASWIGFAAILLLPLRAGELVRPYLIRGEQRLPFSAALGTIGAERVLDGLFVTLVLSVALALVPRLDPLPTSIGDLAVPVAAIPAAASGALALFAAAFVAMVVFCNARGLAARLLDATVGRVSAGAAARMAGTLGELASGLGALARGRHAGPYLLETVAYWALNAAFMWGLGVACGLPVGIGHACSIMGVLAIGVMVPAGPGLFGAFQAATYGVLAMYFEREVVVTAGAAYVFLLYVALVGWQIVCGAAAAVVQIRSRGARRAPADA